MNIPKTGYVSFENFPVREGEKIFISSGVSYFNEDGVQSGQSFEVKIDLICYGKSVHVGRLQEEFPEPYLYIHDNDVKIIQEIYGCGEEGLLDLWKAGKIQKRESSAQREKELFLPISDPFLIWVTSKGLNWVSLWDILDP